MTCLKRAFRGKRPEIMNSDQGSHFTNPDYLNLLKANGIKISMDGKGQALDNVRTERVFRTIKYDCVYINEFHSPRELRIALNEYIHTYNTYRPHSSIVGLCPAQIYNGMAAWKFKRREEDNLQNKFFVLTMEGIIFAAPLTYCNKVLALWSTSI